METVEVNSKNVNKIRCYDPAIEDLRSKDEGLETESSVEQSKVEDLVHEEYRRFKSNLTLLGNEDTQAASLIVNYGIMCSVEYQEKGDLQYKVWFIASNIFRPKEFTVLNRDFHVAFLKKGLRHLGESYECLDASQPWLCYWILHSLELLDEPLADDQISDVAQFLKKCQQPDGGFGGGPYQYAHLAPTEALLSFLWRMRTAEGAFKMHDGGEVDIRGAYCAASVARLTNIITKDLFDGTLEWIVSCQTYEGGFAGCPGMEAHGGYSFCGIAALTLLGHAKLCNIESLLRWTVNRQMSYEGGFQGRTNKLVDGCYSFWQGGAFPLIHMVLSMEDDQSLSAERWMFNQEALQEYILICCQHQGGGLIDKPGKQRDYYHTCYCISGLSVAQHFAGGKLSHVYVVGKSSNEIKPTHPVFNIGIEAVVHANIFAKMCKLIEKFNGIPNSPSF
ncbi:hypothetical protein KUTeg_013100 [Tegillarca granosa]|uniref:Protein farnesyltransferase subunit beta n=1 Tax=Tegillarca granosa TaxID=220873 RepID=A0ABQ9ESQ4_TEGGR|nr:hypothetical protein KUTeg_013100 [Tegillarca granosa]